MKNENYYQVSGWMLNVLKLSGNELLIYAIIFGFSQDNESYFNGSITYLEKCTNASRPTVIKSLKSLIEKGVIIKQENIIRSQSFPTYKVNFDFLTGSKETLPVESKLSSGSKETLPVASKETLPHNYNLHNNINNSAQHNENFLFGDEDLKKLEAEKTEKKTLFVNSEVYKMVKFDPVNGDDYSKFIALYPNPEYKKIDLVFYFNAVLNFSDSKDVKRSKRGWIATVRTFITNDASANKLRLKPEFQQKKPGFDQSMVEFLNGFK